MVWSHPHSTLFFILLALGLCRLAVPGIPAGGRSECAEQRPGGAAGGRPWARWSDPAQPDPRSGSAPDRPAAGGRLPARRSRSMSLESPRTRSQAAEDLIQQAISAGAPRSKTADPKIRLRPRHHGSFRLRPVPGALGRSNAAERGTRAACRPVRRGAAVWRLCFFRRPLDRYRARAARRHRQRPFASWACRCTSSRWATSEFREMSRSQTSTPPGTPGRALAFPVQGDPAQPRLRGTEGRAENPIARDPHVDARSRRFR